MFVSQTDLLNALIQESNQPKPEKTTGENVHKANEPTPNQTRGYSFTPLRFESSGRMTDMKKVRTISQRTYKISLCVRKSFVRERVCWESDVIVAPAASSIKNNT